MKKLLALLALAGTACQPAPSTTPATHPPAGKVAVAPARLVAASLPSPFKPTDTLTAAMRTLLRGADLSALWQGNTPGRRTHPVLEGFFGPDHYRFELAFTRVQRDAQRPWLYYVQGRNHYRQNVRPFTGTLTLRQVAALEPPYEFADDPEAPNQSAAAGSDTATVYERQLRRARPLAVRAELRLAETPQANSGELVGEAILYCYTTTRGQPNYVAALLPTSDGIWNLGYLSVRGTRRNLSTRQLKSFLVADNMLSVASAVYQDFGIGDRFPDQINPKYAHLGWNKKWENEEWWADSPAPSLFPTGELTTSKQAL